MRKVFLFCVLVAGIAMMTGCKKEQTVVTLKAYIDQDTKTYIGTIGTALYPFWNEGDAVRINGVERNMQQADRTYATIPDVDASTSGYYAIYPSSNVRTMDLASGTAQINVPSTQSYTKVNGQQRVDMPMAAFSTTEILQFKNLACIVKVNVTNNIPEYLSDNTTPNPDYGPLAVERIVLTDNASGVNLSGVGDVNITAGSMTVSGGSSVVLTGEFNNAMETLQPGRGHDFYIVVPPFTGKINIKVETTTGKYRKFELNTVTAIASHMATITLNVDNLVGGGDAYLDLGTNVNAAMRRLIDASTLPVKNIIFQYDRPLPNTYTIGTDAFAVHDATRPDNIPVYVALVGPVYDEDLAQYYYILNFFTAASHIYANANSSYMFADLPGMESISSFSTEFITDNVTNMSYMFANNTTLSGLNGISTFNTTHVTTMAGMFENNTAVANTLDLSHFSSASLAADGMVGMFNGCRNLTLVDLSSFHTSQVTSMKELFKGCAKMQTLYLNNFDMSNVTNRSDMFNGLSSDWNDWNQCQIWCPQSEEEAMRNGTGLHPNTTFHNTVAQ